MASFDYDLAEKSDDDVAIPPGTQYSGNLHLDRNQVKEKP